MSIARLKLVFLLILSTVLLKTNAAIATTVAATTVATTPVTTIAPELQDADALFVLLNNRASLMRAVAVAKWRNGGAIEDLKREAQVVERVKSAAQREGLTDVTATTRAQIRLAKLIQTRWHKRWAREGLAGNEYSIPLSTLRARLDVLDAQIWSNLRKVLPALRDAKMHQRLRTVFLRRFRVGDLRDEERLSLFNALLLVRRMSRNNAQNTARSAWENAYLRCRYDKK